MTSESLFRILRHFLFYTFLGSSLGSLIGALTGLSEAAPALRSLAGASAKGLDTLIPRLLVLVAPLAAKAAVGARIGITTGIAVGYVSARIKFSGDPGRRRTHALLVPFAAFAGLMWWWTPPGLSELAGGIAAKAKRSPAGTKAVEGQGESLLSPKTVQKLLKSHGGKKLSPEVQQLIQSQKEMRDSLKSD